MGGVAVRLLLLIAVLSFAAPAAANTPEKRAHDLYNLGKEEMAKGEYRAAIEHFDEAFAIFEHPLILKKRAESREKLNELEEALTDYRAYVDKLGKRKRKERRLIGERIAALEALLLKPVPVTVVASRVGVLVSVDSQTPRRTPFDLHLKPGLHKAEVLDPRYAREAKDVRIPAGRSAIVRLEAVPRTGSVVIVTDQLLLGNARIAIDNEPIRLTPGEQKSQKTAPRQLVVGPHNLVCTMPGRPSYYVEFTVVEGADTRVTCEFEGVRPLDTGPDVWGWVTAGSGAASLLAGAGILVSFGLDVSKEDELNSDSDPTNDVVLETNKHIVGGVLVGVGVALSVGSYFVFTRDRSEDDAAGRLFITPTRDGAAFGASVTF